MLNTLTSAGIPPTGGIRLTQPCPLRSHRCDTFLQKVGAPWDWPDHQDRVHGVWGQCTSWNPRCRPRWPMRTPFPLLIPRSCFCPPTPTPTTQTIYLPNHSACFHLVLQSFNLTTADPCHPRAAYSSNTGQCSPSQLPSLELACEGVNTSSCTTHL